MVEQVNASPAVIRRVNVLNGFECLGSTCEDTCCKHWDMQCDAVRETLYKTSAPELLAAVADGESGKVMKRDAVTGFCVKLEGGLCGIHRDYGTDFLTDACHFYPRTVRSVGQHPVMSAMLSCPEITRLALFSETPIAYDAVEVTRLPATTKAVLTEEISEEAVWKVHQAFLDLAADETRTPEQQLATLVTVARSLGNLPVTSWPDAASFLIRTAEGRMLPAEADSLDEVRVLQAVAIIRYALEKSLPERLAGLVGIIQSVYGWKVDWGTCSVESATEADIPPAEIARRWREEWGEPWQPLLRRWLQMQLSQGFFPFGGLGTSAYERVVVLVVRYATLRLALKALAANDALNQESAVIAVQGLARFMDHLADPELSIRIYEDYGWLHEGRLYGLINGL